MACRAPGHRRPQRPCGGRFAGSTVATLGQRRGRRAVAVPGVAATALVEGAGTTRSWPARQQPRAHTDQACCRAVHAGGGGGERESPLRTAPPSSACGPSPVTTTPRTMATSPSATTSRVSRATRGGTDSLGVRHGTAVDGRPPGDQPGGERDARQHEREQPVAELDGAVHAQLRGRHVAARLALRPRGAPQPGAGERDAGAGSHDAHVGHREAPQGGGCGGHIHGRVRRRPPVRCRCRRGRG